MTGIAMNRAAFMRAAMMLAAILALAAPLLAQGVGAAVTAVSESDIDSSRFSSVDLRATKTIPLPRGTRIELSAQVFNLLNTVNLIAPFQTGYVENVRSASFGKILTAKPGTQAELGARVIW